MKGNSIATFRKGAGKWTNITGIRLAVSLLFYMHGTDNNTGYQKQKTRGETTIRQSIAGLLQPQPFIQRLYPSLMECNDRFVDCFLIYTPHPKFTSRRSGGVVYQAFCSAIEIPNGCLLFETHWHHNGSPHLYIFFPQAKEHYHLFANGMTVLMNSQFEGDGGEVLGNLFKGQKNSDQVAM